MRVLLAGDRAHDRDQGRRAALRVGLECAAADCVSLADLRLRLSREPAIHLVVVFLDPDPTAATRAIKAATGQTRQPVFAVTAETGTERGLQKSVAEAGASAVWPLAQVREGLLSSADELRRDGNVPDRRGRLIAVTAVQPGVGVTTVATGLAFGLVGKEPVLLAELGSGVPELALDLGLEPRHSLGDLIRECDRVDVTMLREAAAKHPAGIDVLAYAPETLSPQPITPAIVRDFQILLRSSYGWTIVDAGHTAGAGESELLLHADAIVVVTRLDPPSLRLTRRYIRALTEAGLAADDLIVVANRYGQAGQIAWQKAEEALRVPDRSWLPDDPRSVNRALTDGRPLIQAAAWSRLTREFKRLAEEVRGRLATAQ